MPNPKDFNLNYRPESYWDSAVSGLTNIKGEMRRRIIKKAFSDGNFINLPGEIFSDELSQDERHLTTSIHPAFMGGEYLPPYLPGEVEIARVSLKSVTWDVYSIRARQTDDGLTRYRVADEYESRDEEPYIYQPEASLQPFTFGELVSFIDNVERKNTELGDQKGLTTYFRDMNYEVIGGGRSEIEGLVDFVRVSFILS